MIPRSVRRLVVALALLLAALPATAAADTKSIEGPFSSNLVPPPTCTSPVGICTLGVLEGDLDATYAFTMTSLVPAGDPSQPNRFIYTGESVITVDYGGAQMFSHDTGVILFEGVDNPFVTTAHVYGGTKRYADAQGTIVATASLNFVTGVATGSYTGSIDK